MKPLHHNNNNEKKGNSSSMEAFCKNKKVPFASECRCCCCCCLRGPRTGSTQSVYLGPWPLAQNSRLNCGEPRASITNNPDCCFPGLPRYAQRRLACLAAAPPPHRSQPFNEPLINQTISHVLTIPLCVVSLLPLPWGSDTRVPAQAKISGSKDLENSCRQIMVRGLTKGLRTHYVFA